MKHGLPSGTVTLLFTDIEGSTFVLRDLGDRYGEVLSEHRRVLRAAFAAHDGVEVDTQGDSFFVAFPRASDAVAAAVEGRHGLATGPMRARIGLHTGEPQRTEEGYAGLDVVRCARIADAGHGGQVLISQTTRALLPELEVRDLGEHRLKDLLEPVRIFQLGREDFPPLRSLNQTNLSLPMTSLVGRRVEREEAARLLRGGVRLLTLVGPPGAGKTRLGLQLASDLAGEFEGGVFIVGLAPFDDPSVVEATIAETVGATNGLVEHLRHRRALLLLDNFEHVTAAAPVVSALLQGAPTVAVVVTSRAPLRLTGEHEFPVAPLGELEAASLFVDRARSAGREVPHNDTVAEICRRLDCLPLAIELAATRTKLLSPQSLLALLERRLPLLVGGPRDAPERQRTLEATIDWSYRLLADEERVLLARLSVFAGGCALDAAEAVCGATLANLGSLVDNSLLRHDDDRFTLLETIREYALGRLAESGEEPTIRRRHAQYLLAVAKHLVDDAGPEHPDGTEWLARFADEHENFRAALEWSYAAGESDVLCQLVHLLHPYWAVRGRADEKRLWLDRAIASGPQGLLLRKLLIEAAHVAIQQENFDRASELLDESLELNRAARDELGVAISLHELSLVAIGRGDYGSARALLDEAGKAFERLGASGRRAAALHDLGLLALQQGDTRRACDLLEQELALLGGEGHGARAQVGNALADVGFVALVEGRDAEATDALRKALVIARDLGNPALIAECVMWIAALVQRRGELYEAARLAAAADRLRVSLLLPPMIYARDVHDAVVAAAHDRATAWDEGRALPLDQAVEEALAAVRPGRAE